MNDGAARSGAGSVNCSVFCFALENVTWLDGSACLYDEDVAVFRFHYVNNMFNELTWRSLLSPDEIQRAQQYRREEDQYRSLYTRSLLRLLVAKYVHQQPSSVRFTIGNTGKPELLNSSGWHINAAHAGDWIVLTIGKVSVGVDVEKIVPDFPFHDVVRYSLSLPEQRYVESDENARLRFYQLWTRKEALVKATAKGIDNDFCQVPSLNGFYELGSTCIGAPGVWVVGSFFVADEYPAAVAYQTSIGDNLRFYTISNDLFDQWCLANV